jgi:competence protein ComEC
VIDGRLLAPAVAVWLGALAAGLLLGLSVELSDRHELAVGMCRATAALAVALAGWVCLQSRAGRRQVPTGVVISAAAGLLGVLMAGLHVAALTPAPLTTWTQGRAVATVRGIVTGEPVVRNSLTAASWQPTSHLEVRLATSRVSARGGTVDVEVPLLLRLAAGSWVPPPGTEVDLVGRLGPMPARSGVAAGLTVAGSDGAIAVIRGPGVVDRVAHAMRVGLRSALADVPADAGALVAGLAVGDESGQSASLAQEMRSSGLSHLTAVSGGNTAIVVAVVLAAAAGLRLALMARIVAALLALAFFVVLVGPQPSVLRAAAMGGIVLMGMMAGGRRSGPSVLAASVLVLVVLSPALAASWGFALSAGAAAGLILLAPRVRDALDRWRLTARWPPALREASALTIAAQVATLPLLVGMGAAVGWVCLPANLLAMPAVAPVTVLGLVAAVISVPLPGLASVVGRVAAWPAGWIAGVAHVCSGLPLAQLPWPTGWWGVVLLAVGALVTWFVRRRLLPGLPRQVRLQFVVASGAVLALVAGLWLVAPPGRRNWPPTGWFMIMCDVGQGDAILVRSAPGTVVVIDAGPDPDLVDRCLDDAAVTAVAAIVLTHFHADHVNGLTGILRDRDVAEVFVNPIRDPPEQAIDVDRWLAQAGRIPTVLTAGDRRVVGDVEWVALWPRRLITEGSIPNNASIVLVVTVAGHEVLLSGDIESEAQVAVSADLKARRFDVVKVPHHASIHQSASLTSWAPAPFALVSVGAGNLYGQPAPETIADWQRHGSLVARTDRDGDVAVISRGRGVAVVPRRADLP